MYGCVGSIFFCSLMYRSKRFVPRFLAAWGAVGYAIFAAGCLLVGGCSASPERAWWRRSPAVFEVFLGSG